MKTMLATNDDFPDDVFTGRDFLKNPAGLYLIELLLEALLGFGLHTDLSAAVSKELHDPFPIGVQGYLISTGSHYYCITKEAGIVLRHDSLEATPVPLQVDELCQLMKGHACRVVFTKEAGMSWILEAPLTLPVYTQHSSTRLSPTSTRTRGASTPVL
jgi:hypothetical protein